MDSPAREIFPKKGEEKFLPVHGKCGWTGDRRISMDVMRREHRSYGWLLVIFFIVANSVGCSGGESSGSCELGQTKSCSCGGGEDGIRVCNSNLKYTACECGDGGEDDASIRINAQGVAAARKGHSSRATFGSSGDSGTNNSETGGSGDTSDSGEEGEKDGDTTSSNGGESGQEESGGGTSGSGAAGQSESGSGGSSGQGDGGGGGASGQGESGTGPVGDGGANETVDNYQYSCPSGHEPTVPSKTGSTCPAITTTYAGDVNAHNPISFKGKDVEFIVGERTSANAAADIKGAIFLWWHPLDGNPWQIVGALGVDAGLRILRRGSVIVAMHGNSSMQYGTDIAPEWDLNHLAAADEVIACIIEEMGDRIDKCRIHAIGFSAGGLMTSQMSYRRSNYLASVVAYSGGINTVYPAPSYQNENNKFAAMVIYGGNSDVFPPDNPIFDFKQASLNYLNDLKTDGHFAFACNHNQGHTIPVPTTGDTLINSAWRFLEDHPYGVEPEPYQTQLPSGFPAYCSLP